MSARRRTDRDNKAGSEAYLKSVCRMIRSYTKAVRAGEIGDSETLAHLAALRRELDEQTALCVLEMNSRGVAWQEIGDGLGMDRAAAYNKYVRRVRVDRLLSDDNARSAVEG